ELDRQPANLLRDGVRSLMLAVGDDQPADSLGADATGERAPDAAGPSRDYHVPARQLHARTVLQAACLRPCSRAAPQASSASALRPSRVRLAAHTTAPPVR